MKNYLIAGNGVAGTTAAENIRKQDKKGNITIVTDEDLPFYWRIQLNEYISGDISEEQLLVKKEEWYKDQKRFQRQIGAHQEADENYIEQGIRLIEIARNAHAFFQSKDQPKRAKLV